MRSSVGQIFVVCCLLGWGCGDGSTEVLGTGGAEANGATADATTTVPPSTEPDEPTTTTPLARPIEAYVPPEGWSIMRQLGVASALLHEDGATIEVSLIGGPQAEPSDPCARNYELVVAEGEQEVRATIFELHPAGPDEVPDNYTCTSVGHGWRLEGTLKQPLGDRGFVDELTGEQTALVDLAEVLNPAYVPAGWTALPPQVYNGQLERYYSDDTKPDALLYMWSAPVDGLTSVESIRSRDLVEVDEITIRSNEAIQVTSLEDGAVTIAWEEGDHLYQVHGYRVDPTELIAIAESME